MADKAPFLPSVELANQILANVGWRCGYNALLRRPEFIRLSDCSSLSPDVVPPHARVLDADAEIIAALRAYDPSVLPVSLSTDEGGANWWETVEGGNPWRALSFKNAWMALLEAIPGDPASVYDPVDAYGVLLDEDGQEVAVPPLPAGDVIPHYTMLQRARHPVSVWQPVAVVSPLAAERLLPPALEQYTEHLFEIRPLPRTRAEAKRRAERSQGRENRVLVYYCDEPATAAGDCIKALPNLPSADVALHTALRAFGLNPRQRITMQNAADMSDPTSGSEWKRPVSDLACDLAAQILDDWDESRRASLADLIIDTDHPSVTIQWGGTMFKRSRDMAVSWLNLDRSGMRLRDDVAAVLREAGKESYQRRGRMRWRTQGAPDDDRE